MEPKRNQKGTSMLGCCPLFGVTKRFANTAPFFCRFWKPLGAFWPPSGHVFAHSGSRWGAFWTTNRRAKPSKTSEMNPDARGNGKPPRTCRDSAEDCREPTKNCREPSQNPPRTCRTNPKQKNLSRYGFYESTSFSDRSSNKTPRTKVGRRCSRLGGLQEKCETGERENGAALRCPWVPLFVFLSHLVPHRTANSRQPGKNCKPLLRRLKKKTQIQFESAAPLWGSRASPNGSSNSCRILNKEGLCAFRQAAAFPSLPVNCFSV